MNQAEQLFDDANGHLAVGEIEEAIALYRRSVEIDSNYFDAWHALGMALMKDGQTAMACLASSSELLNRLILRYTRDLKKRSMT